jgi:hypothetical protein
MSATAESMLVHHLAEAHSSQILSFTRSCLARLFVQGVCKRSVSFPPLP